VNQEQMTRCWQTLILFPRIGECTAMVTGIWLIWKQAYDWNLCLEASFKYGSLWYFQESEVDLGMDGSHPHPLARDGWGQTLAECWHCPLPPNIYNPPNVFDVQPERIALQISL
jgi:hypothetical protein